MCRFCFKSDYSLLWFFFPDFRNELADYGTLSCESFLYKIFVDFCPVDFRIFPDKGFDDWLEFIKFTFSGMKEAATAYIDYLFKECNARRIFAYTEDYNISCQRLLEKLGFRQEGFYKEFVSFVNDADGNPVYENTYEYAILKKEWKMLDN